MKKTISIILIGLMTISGLASCNKLPGTANVSGKTKTIGEIKKSYGVTATQEENQLSPFWNMNQDTKFVFHFNSKVEPILAVSVHTDPKCEINSRVGQLNAAYLCDDGVDVIVKPGLAVLSDEQNQTEAKWGNAPIYYLRINYDRYSTEVKKLDKPIIIPFTVKADVSTPTATGAIDSKGQFQLNWTPVDGATSYEIFESSVGLRKETNETIKDYTRSELGYKGDHLTKIAEVSDTTFSDFNYSTGQKSYREMNGYIQEQNTFLPLTYFVRAKSSDGKVGNFSMAVEAWKSACNMPSSVDLYELGETFPDTVPVKMKDGTTANMPINFKKVSEGEFEDTKYEYTIPGTMLTGYVYKKTGDMPDTRNSEVTSNAGVYEFKNSESIIPANTVEVLTDQQKEIISDDGTKTLTTYPQEMRLAVAEMENVRLLQKGLYSTTPEDLLNEYGSIYGSGVESTPSSTPENNTTTPSTPSNDNTTPSTPSNANDSSPSTPQKKPNKPSNPSPQSEPTTTQPSESESPSGTTSEDPEVTTRETDDIYESDDEADDDIDEPEEDSDDEDDEDNKNNADEESTEEPSVPNDPDDYEEVNWDDMENVEPEVKQEYDTEVPDTDYDIFADNAEEEYLARMMIDHQDSIDLKGFPKLQDTTYLTDVLQKVALQNPYIISAQVFEYDAGNKALLVKYEVDKAGAEKRQKEIQKEAASIVSSVIKSGMSDEEKALALWNKLEDDTEYDNAACENAEKNNFQGVDSEYVDAFNAYGILCKKVGVCQSYALAYKLLLSEADVDAIVLTGYLNRTMPHAWNAINIDGSYYWYDVTNNAKTSGIPYMVYESSSTEAESMDYVLGDTFEIDKNLGKAKNDDDTKNFYAKNNLIANSPLEIPDKCVAARHLKRHGVYAIYVKGGVTQNDITAEVATKIAQALVADGMSESELQNLKMGAAMQYVIFMEP